LAASYVATPAPSYWLGAAAPQSHTLSLHDALPIYGVFGLASTGAGAGLVRCHHRLVGEEGVIEIGPAGQGMPVLRIRRSGDKDRSEEHTSELQSRENVVCRLLLEKKDGMRAVVWLP